MAQVTLEIGGRRYDVGCRDGEEARLRLLGSLVDSRTDRVIRAVGRGNEPRELVLTALLLADELDEAQAGDGPLLAAIEACATRLEALASMLEAPAPIDPVAPDPAAS